MTPSPDTPPPADRIEQYLVRTGLALHHPTVDGLTPDASDRRYFRVRAEGRDPLVLAVHAGPIEFARMPFAIVSGMLAEMAMPAPAVVGHDDSLGIIALQDLGDVTLQAQVNGRAVSAEMALYEEAVALIVRLQQQGFELESDNLLPYRLAFDVEKFTFEFTFFIEHFLGGHRGVVLTAAERAALDDEFGAITSELAGEPRVLCHRDYHSRNLMVHGGYLHLIDFQDARMGPDTYDLASLLRDSYVDVSEEEVDLLIAHFRRLAHVEDADEFRRRFDLMCVQRNIKALGTFGFQASVRRNEGYLRDVPRTLGHVRRNLAKYERFSRLRELLGAHVEELR